MEVYFRTGKQERVFNSARMLSATYGQLAEAIKRRLAFLAAAPNLAAVPHTPPTRRHALTGERRGQYAVDLSRNDRLIFEAANEPVPRLADGGVDLARVTAVRIVAVEDYH